MTTESIHLSDELKELVDQRVSNIGFSSIDEYINQLIRKDMEGNSNNVNPSEPDDSLPIWAVRAASEIDTNLSKLVTENTGLKFGFFAGISINDIAKIIHDHSRLLKFAVL